MILLKYNNIFLYLTRLLLLIVVIYNSFCLNKLKEIVFKIKLIFNYFYLYHQDLKVI